VKKVKAFFMNLKLSQKIVITPVVILIFTLILFSLFYMGLAKQKSVIDDIYNNRFKGYQHSSRIMNDMANVQANTYRVISWANAKYDEKKVDQLAKQQIASLDQTINQVTAIVKSAALPTGRPFFRRIWH